MIILVLGLATAGCVVVGRARANAAFERGDYVTAADKYGVLVEKVPDNTALRERRDEARRRALGTLTERVHRLRTGGKPEPALTALAELLSRHRAWREADDAAVARAIDDEVAAAGRYLDGEVQRLLAGRQALAAEQAIATRRKQLAFVELESVWPALEREAHDGGDAICRAAVPDDVDESPYLARLAAAYCEHFHVAAHVPARLPHGVAGVAVDGEISGMTTEQRERLNAVLQRLMQGRCGSTLMPRPPLPALRWAASRPWRWPRPRYSAR